MKTRVQTLATPAKRTTGLGVFGFALFAALVPINVQAADRVPTLGIVALSDATMRLPYIDVFTPRLKELGWIEGKNLRIEYRFAQGAQLDYRAGVKELIDHKVDVIYALAAPAGKVVAQATQTIPTVMQDYTNDPVAAGYAVSYGQPGRNITGVFLDAPELAGKWLQILRDMVPGLRTVGVLWDPAPGRNHLDTLVRIAQREGLKTLIYEARNADELEAPFRRMRGKVQALVILPSPMTFTYGKTLAELALQYRIPATHMAKQFAGFGGTVSYGPNNTESTLRNAEQIAKILNGVNPGAIPIERPFKYDFLINTRTVKALKLKLPDHLQLGAELVQ